MKKTVAIILAMLILLTAIFCSACIANAAIGATLSYTFDTEDANKAGFAEGTINLSVNNSESEGTYYLYWADDEKALDGYRYIAVMTVDMSTKGTYSMLEHTVIPAGATQVIAIKSDDVPSDKSVSNAAAVYAIEQSKQLPVGKPIYTFGAFSDPQLANDSYGEGKYPYDEDHLAQAFESYAERGVDFLISSGDTVNDQNGGVTYATEYKRYQKILAESSYVNPIWECNGNHDVHVDWYSGEAIDNEPFIKGTGLDSKAESIKANIAYFEITESTTGDHFIFMAQEDGFYTNEGEQFSDAQLSWLEGLLKKYHGDGKNIFIIEHANVENWGSGDKYPDPYYDLGMTTEQTSTAKFIELMETYKECIIVTGHTHLELSAHLNYSDNDETSAVMIHNSAVGGVRRLVNGSIDRTPVEGLSEGYIVEVYDNCVVFNGTNLYYNEIMPDCSYIIETSTSALETEVPTVTESETSVVQDVCYGDVDIDGRIAITDATLIQLYLAQKESLSEEQLANAKVTGADRATIMDATAIQQKLAFVIDKFPVEEAVASVSDKSVADVSANDISTLLANANNELTTNYIYSSYDQYQALKKYVRELEGTGENTDSAYSKLSSLYEELKAIIEATGGTTGEEASNTIDVYFTNIPNWSNVYAYAWNGGTNNGGWPGEQMEYVKTNSQSQKIYKITLEADKYKSIIFSNGSGEQTVDLTLSNENNEGFYTTTKSSGKYNCETYTFS